MKHALVASVALTVLTLTACTGGQQRRGPPKRVIERVLKSAPGAAQPSAIVKAEIAYGQAAEAEGLYTAGLEYAASGALLHGRSGPVPFENLSKTLDDPALATQWRPRTVVMSCDGALALSQGRFEDAEGKVGTYVTTWVRQSNNGYKWSYDVAGRDTPQPPPRPALPDADITVTAIDSILGLVATCPGPGEEIPPPPAIPIGEDGKTDAQLSRDGTLRWLWEHRADGTKYVKAQYWYEGAWETAFEESLASPPE